MSRGTRPIPRHPRCGCNLALILVPVYGNILSRLFPQPGHTSKGDRSDHSVPEEGGYLCTRPTCMKTCCPKLSSFVAPMATALTPTLPGHWVLGPTPVWC